MTTTTNSPLTGKSVLFLINQDLGGGVEYLAHVLAGDLQQRGAKCATRFIYPTSSGGTATKIRHVLRKAVNVAKAAPDVIITFQPTASAIATIAGRIGGCRVRIVHQSNSPVKSHVVMRELDKILGSTGAYSVTIANSRATISEFDAYPKPYRKKIRLIEHGIPPPVHALNRRDILAKFNIPDDAPLLLMAARLDLQKGQHIIVSALQELPRVRLVMAGSGPEKQNLLAQARAVGVEDRLHFLGHVERQDLMDLYRAASLMVFPSQWETFGLAAVEAAMVGLPVIAADIPALREVLAQDGHTTAKFVTQRQPHNWAMAIAEALADPALRPRSEEFAAVIQDKYSERRMIDGYDRLYRELIA